MTGYISPVGYVDLDNDPYSLDYKTTRSREYVNPKEDLAFYFQTYLIPKYGLDNINVSNVATFMKELEMNWTKLSPELKDNVLDILVDNILVSDNYDFKNRLLSKLNIKQPSGAPPQEPVNNSTIFSKSTFGSSQDYVYILVAIVAMGLLIFLLKSKQGGFPKMT